MPQEITKDHLSLILRDWVGRVLQDLDRNQVCPCPWNLAQAIAAAGRMLGRLDPDDFVREDE